MHIGHLDCVLQWDCSAERWAKTAALPTVLPDTCRQNCNESDTIVTQALNRKQ